MRTTRFARNTAVPGRTVHGTRVAPVLLGPMHALRQPSCLVAVALCSAMLGCSRSPWDVVWLGRAHRTTAARVTVATAQRRESPRTIALAGTLVPDVQSALAPRVAGHVLQVYAERGSVVHAGDPLVRLQDTEYRASVDAALADEHAARARLGGDALRSHGFDPARSPDALAAQATMESAEDAARRMRAGQAVGGGFSAQELVHADAAARTAREQYQAALAAARASYFAFQGAHVAADRARTALDESIIRAPFDGEVAERQTAVGEHAMPEQPVLTLVRIDPLRLELQVPQERVSMVRRGQRVDLRVDAFPGRAFSGTIRYISAAVRTDDRALVAEAVVPNPDGALRPGLFATAYVTLDGREDLVAIPSAALVSDMGVDRVYVVRDGRAQERVVALRAVGEHEALVAEGLAPTERVALDHFEELFDGAPVVVR